MAELRECEVSSCTNLTANIVNPSPNSWMVLCETHAEGFIQIQEMVDIEGFLSKCYTNFQEITLEEYDRVRRFTLDVRSNIALTGIHWIHDLPSRAEINYLMLYINALWPQFHPNEPITSTVCPTK